MNDDERTALEQKLAALEAQNAELNAELNTKRAVAAKVAKLPGTELHGWWGALPSIAVLAGKRAVLVDIAPDDHSPILIDTIDQSAPAVKIMNEHIAQYCGETLIEVPRYLICAPK